jgi:hypothetical protein
MAKEAAKRRDIGISSSVLGGCPRQHILGREKDYFESPEDYYARWFGSFGHYAIEMDGPYPGILQEKRFFRSITTPDGPYEISGQPDWIDTRLGLIADHKMVGRKPREPRKEHIQQLNVYRWLVSPTIPIERLEIRYYHPGPNGRHLEYEIPVWTEANVETYIRSKLIPYAKYQSTGSLDGIGVFGPQEAWRYDYCPWRHGCNPGTCCLAPDERLLDD